LLLREALRICVIGPGRLGLTLVASLRRAGFAVHAVVGSPGSPLDPAADPPRLALTDALAQADLIWITVPDDAIEGVAHDVAAALPRPLERPVACIHSSGLGSLALLAPLRGRVAGILSLHPLQSFAAPGDDDTLRGVPMAVTGDTPADVELGTWLAERLGGRPFALADDAKPLYHLAAAVASNLFVALQSEAGELAAAATGLEPGDAARLLAPLVATTAANVAARGPAGALTGPVARGDVGTVRAHLELLAEQAPRFADTYRALSLQALRLAAPRLDDEAVHALRELLDRPEGRL
jgi:predicted short-subunit dehydrogenase-like oxidoreductase (DUF2520 family)